MSHLTLETLARVADEGAGAGEAAHLEACAACRGALNELRADIATLATLPAIEPPPGVWRGIANRARAEGLIRDTVVMHPRGMRFGLPRLAAALFIFATGMAAGVAWAGGSNSALDPTMRGSAPIAEASLAPVVDLGTEFLTARQPANPEEAERLLQEVEVLFYYAMMRNSELTPASSSDGIVRLATLEGITSITGTALNQAPADPVINGLHLAAMAQRDATLKHLAVSTANSW